MHRIDVTNLQDLLKQLHYISNRMRLNRWQEAQSDLRYAIMQLQTIIKEHDHAKPEGQS